MPYITKNLPLPITGEEWVRYRLHRIGQGVTRPTVEDASRKYSAQVRGTFASTLLHVTKELAIID